MQQEHVHFSKNTLSQLDNYYGMYYNLFNISFHQNGKPTFPYNDDDHHLQQSTNLRSQTETSSNFIYVTALIIAIIVVILGIFSQIFGK